MSIIYQPATPKQQFYLYLIMGIILLSLWPIYLAYLSPIVFPLDDAYIVLHNAQVLHWGHDPNYVGVPALIGSSSILHTLLVSLLLFWLAPPKALLLAQWLSNIIYVFGLLRLAFLLNATVWQIVAIILFALTTDVMSYHLLSGLDTTMAMAGMVWSLVFANQTITRLQRIALACLCGILPFIRPELGLWSIFLLAYQAYRYWQLQRSFKITLSQLAQDGCLVLLMAAPWILVYWLNTQLLLPSTMQSKAVFTAFLALPFFTKLSEVREGLTLFVKQISYLGVLGMLSLLLLTFLGRLILVFILCFLIFYIHYFSIGITVNGWRYLYPLLPLLIYGLLVGLRHQNKFIKIGTYILLELMLLQAIWLWPKHWLAYYDARAHTLNELKNVAQWVQKNIPKDAVLLVHDAGYLAFATQFQLIDLVGLKSPISVSYHKQITLPSGGKNRIQAINAIMQYSHVQFLVAKKDWCEMLDIPNGLSKFGWHWQLIRSVENGFSIYRVYK